MKSTQEKIAVMQAYADGKKIEIYTGREWEEWGVPAEPHWNWEHIDYRVKSEPKYRPYADAEEVMEAIKEHGSWLKWKDGAGYNIITLISMDFPNLWLGQSTKCITYDEAYYELTFADGTPFGKLEK